MARGKRKYNLTGYYKSGVLFFGVLLFCVSQLLRFIQLFRDAAARKSANQAPPENFTAAGITWAALITLLIALICFLLYRNRSGRLRLQKSRAYMLLSTLLTLWGLYHFVTFIIEMARNSELALLFDIAAIAAGVIVPVLLLQISDITGGLADDVTLLISSIGGAALSAVSLVVLFILRKGYSNSQLLLVTEILFRVALLLVSLAALTKAIVLRNAYPITEPVEPQRERAQRPAPKPAKRAREEDAPFTLRLDGEADADAPRRSAARPVVEDVGRRAQRHVSSLMRYAEQGFADEEPPRDARAQAERAQRSAQAGWDTGRIIVQGGTGRIRTQDPGYVPSERQTCPYCGKRMPVGFPNCPRCGRDM